MATPGPDGLKDLLFGQILPESDPSSPLPLKHTRVNASITGLLSTVTVTQTFTNPFKNPLELEYLFPLPEEAAISGFEIKLAERTIQGRLEETEKAAEEYHQAVQDGKQAGLISQQRENLFTVKLGNVLPEISIEVMIRYSQPVRFDDGKCEFVFPMGITPRYHSPRHPQESRGVDAPIAGPGEAVGPVEISLTIDSGVPTGDPTSPSHAIHTVRSDDAHMEITLAEAAIPDHDFIVRYALPQDHLSLPAWRLPHKDGDIFLAHLIPPPLSDMDSEPSPREFVFVLDRSGSMSGEPIAQARNALRACLRSLSPADTFSLLLFDDMIEWFRTEPTPVNQANIDAADRFLAQVQGRGGTEIVAALQAALARPSDPARMRFVVFLTDGAVSAEERVLEETCARLGSARIFTFGIGPSVNRMLLERLAQAGRGASEFLQLDEDIEEAVIKFQDRVSFPVLTDLRFEVEHGKLWDVYPSILPDLYAGQTISLTGRLRANRSHIPLLKLKGMRGGEPVEMRIELPLKSSESTLDRSIIGPAMIGQAKIGQAWARARVHDLLLKSSASGQPARNVRAELIALALEFGLVTPYTSFVAIDSQPVNAQNKPQRILISQPLPQGLSPQGFTVQSQTLAFMPPPSPAMARTPTGQAGSLLNRTFSKISAAMSAPSTGTTGASNSIEEVSSIQQYELAARGPVEDPLHWLARTQKLDGSWDGDIEKTSAALLAFLKAGQTTQTGHYRSQMRRAFTWLSASSAGPGFPAFARALALLKLSAATQKSEHIQAANQAAGQLPTPSNAIEKAFQTVIQPQGSIQQPSDEMKTLVDLRLADLVDPSSSKPDLKAIINEDLAEFWLAVRSN